LLRSIRMRLDLCGETFAIYDVPAGVDLSILPRAQWSRRERALRANAKDAAFIQAELARLGVRLTDDEVRDAVADALDSDIVKGAAAVAAFGDRRAVPELSNAFDDFEHLDCAACDYVALSAIANAIHTLGGVPTDGQREKLAAYHDRQRGAWIKPRRTKRPWRDSPPSESTSRRSTSTSHRRLRASAGTTRATAAVGRSTRSATWTRTPAAVPRPCAHGIEEGYDGPRVSLPHGPAEQSAVPRAAGIDTAPRMTPRRSAGGGR
jgi:hypothetical protein